MHRHIPPRGEANDSADDDDEEEEERGAAGKRCEQKLLPPARI